MNYFIIPGNPPAVYFYEKWGQEIKAQDLSAKVFVSDYSTPLIVDDAKQAMHNLTQHHQKNLLRFYEETQEPVLVIGHSLGAFFALNLLELSASLIKRAVLLHPFIKAPSLSGKLILKSAASLYEKNRMQNFLVKNRRFLELFSEELYYISDQEMLQSFSLARHESLTIGIDKKKLKLDEKIREQVIALCHPKDQWCKKVLIDDLRKQVKLIDCHEPHDFIVNADHRKSILRKIYDQIDHNS